MTASLMLLGLGLKLRIRWSTGIRCVGWRFRPGDGEMLVGACVAGLCDSSSMAVGSIVVVELLVVLVL